MNSDEIIAIVGLGYVGLPLAVEYGKKWHTIGIDISDKIENFMRCVDPTGHIAPEQFKVSSHLELSTEFSLLAAADYIVIAVPTPVDIAHNPDLTPLIRASESVGRHMKRGVIVIYESTVYPGATEEVCIPVLEKFSGMKWKDGFHIGYSPERINPGDKAHTLTTVMKVVAADDAETLERVAALYESVVRAGVHRVSSLKVAEAAKVIENTQRDLNIALMNELAIIFDQMGIDTLEVLKAAGTKWNFLPFRPGLVGGHCIGVDPYYLTHKAEMIGYHPQVILAGRRINDGMAKFVAEKTVKSMISAGFHVKGSKVNVIGLTFKEDCPDLRNSKAADIVRELGSYGCDVHIYDPVADSEEAQNEYGIKLDSWEDLPRADAVIVAVPHKEVLEHGLDEHFAKLNVGACFIDIKGQYDSKEIRDAGYCLWRL